MNKKIMEDKDIIFYEAHRCFMKILKMVFPARAENTGIGD